MRRFLYLFLPFMSLSSFAAGAEPYFKSAPMPFYPPLARQARISGKVALHFVVNGQGDTSDINALVESNAVNGQELLRQTAIENLQKWKFAWPQPCDCRSHKEVVFVYKFSGKLESPERPTVTVRWFSKTEVVRVEIEGDLVLHSD